MVATSRPLGCRHILVRHAVLLWPGLSKRLPAPGWWGGDPTVATLPRDPGASRKTKTEVQSDSPRGFREVPPPHNVTFPSYPPNPDVATSHGCGDLSDASGKEGRSCGGFLEDLCAPSQEGDERFGKCVAWVRGPSCSALGSVSWGRLHQAHSSCCIYTYLLGTECLTCRRTDHSAYSSSCWLQGRKTQPPAGGAFDL